MPRSGKTILLAILFGILSIAIVVAGDTAEDILSKMQKKYDTIKDATVTFTQHVQFGVTKSEETFSGKLVMKKGNKYRIEMEQQILVTDGKSVWSYAKVNNQVLIDRYKEDPKAFSPDKILVNVPANYTSTLLGKEKLGGHETAILKLVPRNDKSNIQWMKVWVDDDDALMRKIQVRDVSENLTTYTISDILLNTGVPESQFTFDAPAGVEVIDLR
jgi:outer membrane lipoprotein carrier protein